MKAFFRLKNTDKIEATMSITMEVGDWKDLIEQITSENTYPAWGFKNLVKSLVRKAEMEFEGEPEEIHP